MLFENVFGTILEMFESLFYPFLFFVGLGMVVKGKKIVIDAKRALRESSLNIQISLFNVILTVPLLVLAAIKITEFMQANNLYLISTDHWNVFPKFVVVIIAVFIADFVGYWRHRLEHTKVLWPSHAVHHSDTEMTWLALERFHPINRATTFFIDSFALWVLGFPPYAIVINNLIRHYYGYFIHADLPWTYGWFGKIFVSPAMHRWHHAVDYKAFNTNFATVFSIFDRAFGTFRVPGPCDIPLGVTDDMEQNLASQISYAFKPRAYKRLFSKSKKQMK